MIISVSDRIKNVDEYYFSKKLERIRQMNLTGADVINLGIGSPDLMPSSQTIEAAVSSIRSEQSHGYSSYRSTPRLRKAIQDWYKNTYAVSADSESEILPLLGSKEGIHYITMAFTNPGDGVLVPNPGYPAYASLAQIAGAKIIPYELMEKNNWFPDFAQLEQLDLKNVKLMWVNYPHMPTGTVGSDDLFRRLIEFGHRHRIMICHDNPYSMVLNQNTPRSILNFDPEKEISLELNSLSKSFNMAGWRVGMVVANSKVIESILRVKSNVDSGMFLPIQMGAIQAFSNSQQWHDDRNQIYHQRREIVFEIFDLLKFKYDPKQVGMFVWAKASSDIDNIEAFIDHILIQSHVFLTPGFIFGSQGTRYVRASLCAPVERIKEALLRIQTSGVVR